MLKTDQKPKATTPPPEPTAPSGSSDNKILKKIATQADNPQPMSPTPSPSSSKPLVTILVAFLLVAAGTATGLGVSKVISIGTSAPVTKTAQQASQEGVAVGDIIGLPDKSTFKDSAQGVLVKGGTGGEGSHHLLREGGADQNVYLTSSVLDLDQLVGHKVEVWGETFAAQTAGWLMDVGRAEVLELNAQPPFVEKQ